MPPCWRPSNLAPEADGPRQDPGHGNGSGLPLSVLEAIEAFVHRGAGRRPVLALNGPVGAGKSTLARTIADLASRRGLRLAVASIDDLYLPLAERRSRLAGNPFGVSRVPPGCHDVPLLLERLQAWRSRGILRLPCFDKSLAAGEGERSGEREQEADALLLEGWLMGCRALGGTRLAELLAEGLQDWPLSEAELGWIPHWDRALADYHPLWQACDGLWLLRPTAWTLPRRWRFQAEARQRRLGAGWLDGAALGSLVRSSLHSLPPPLYQDPLLVEGSQGLPLLGVSVLDGRRRVVVQSTHSSASSASSAIG